MVLARRGMRGGGSRLGLVSRPQVFSVPLWVPAAGKFGDASTNEPADIDPDPTNAAVYAGVSGFLSVWDSWNGGVYAPTLGAYGSLLMFGGGNRSYDGNGVVRCDLESRLFSMLTSPAAYSSLEEVSGDNNTTNVNVSVNGAWPNGTPSPVHTYCTPTFIPAAGGGGTLGSFVFLNHLQNNVHITTSSFWMLDLSALTWSRWTPSQWFGPYNYNGMCYDASRNVAWLVAPTHPSEYSYGNKGLLAVNFSSQTITEVTLTGTPIASNRFNVGLYQPAPAYCAARDCIVFPIDGSSLNILCVDLNGYTVGSGSVPVHQITQSGTPCPSLWMDPSTTPVAAGALEYSAYDGALWMLSQHTTTPTLFKLAPPGGALTGTWAWTSETLTAANGESLALRNSTEATVDDHHFMGRFRYVASLKGFVFSDGRDLKAQACRPAAFV